MLQHHLHELNSASFFFSSIFCLTLPYLFGPGAVFTPLAFLPHWHVKWRAIMGPEAVVLWESILFAGRPLLTIHLPQPMRRFWCAPSQREATDSSPRNSHTIWGSNSRMWKHTVRSACSFFFFSTFGCVQCAVRAAVTVRWAGMIPLSSFVLLLFVVI